VSAIISAIRPGWVVPGGRVVIDGTSLPIAASGPPLVLVGLHESRVVAASSRSITLSVPAAAEGGTMAVRVGEAGGPHTYLEVARTVATGLHQVDSPAFDGLGRLYVTQSGGRGTRVSVPLYRLALDGAREPIAVEIANPTSVALGPDGAMYVSSRFDGHVHRLTADDQAEPYATDLGVATGVAFAPDGAMFVGDRAGSIFRVLSDRRVETFATLPASVAAFHLAFGPDGCLYVTAPTLSSHDALYRITPDRLVDVVCETFGRPQGLAFDAGGHLYVVDALAGSAGLFRVDLSRERIEPELVVSASTLVGVCFKPTGGIILASNDTIWALDVDVRPPGPESAAPRSP
jgi:sugar lactone lactonase YvrE